MNTKVQVLQVQQMPLECHAPLHSIPRLRTLNFSAHSLTLLRNCSNPEFLVVFSKYIDSLAMSPEMEIDFIEKENTHLL